MIAQSEPRAAVDGAWPLRGSESFALPRAAWRDTIAVRLQAILRRHVIDAWFPRTLDHGLGGFASDFDRRWRPTRPDDRMLEYQARTTRTVARIGQALPNEPEWRDYAMHGLRYLLDAMRDPVDGGFFWLIGRDGTPLAMGSKHAHSTAYTIGALVEVYRLTGAQSALDAARETFDWLETTLHDDEHGGYHGWATRDGRAIADRSLIADWSSAGEPLGHDIGLKDLNVHSDLLESFYELADVARSTKLSERAGELYGIVVDRFATPDAGMHYLLNADLSPVIGPERPGYAFQAAYRLPLLAPWAGRATRDALSTARALVDHVTSSSTGRARGFLDSGEGATGPHRPWWVQTEAAQALIMLAVNFPDAGYVERLNEHLAFIENQFLDQRYGGFHGRPRSDRSLTERWRSNQQAKATRWKDASHEAQMCLLGIRMLRGLRDTDPVD